MRSQIVDPSNDLRPQLDSIMKMQIEAEAARAGFAHTMHEALMKRVSEILATLKEDEEIVGGFASFGQVVTISITSIDYQNPHLMVFEGFKQDGERVVLLQHTSQVNIMLTGTKVTGRKPNRIGFGPKQE